MAGVQSLPDFLSKDSKFQIVGHPDEKSLHFKLAGTCENNNQFLSLLSQSDVKSRNSAGNPPYPNKAAKNRAKNARKKARKAAERILQSQKNINASSVKKEYQGVSIKPEPGQVSERNCTSQKAYTGQKCAKSKRKKVVPSNKSQNKEDIIDFYVQYCANNNSEHEKTGKPQSKNARRKARIIAETLQAVQSNFAKQAKLQAAADLAARQQRASAARGLLVKSSYSGLNLTNDQLKDAKTSQSQTRGSEQGFPQPYCHRHWVMCCRECMSLC